MSAWIHYVLYQNNSKHAGFLRLGRHEPAARRKHYALSDPFVSWGSQNTYFNFTFFICSVCDRVLCRKAAEYERSSKLLKQGWGSMAGKCVNNDIGTS